MFMKKSLIALIIFFLVGSASADTHIEYTLDGDWSYEQEYPGTLSLSDNTSGGITATINVPTGLKEGGLGASRHDLPGFSIDNDGFIELCYSTLTSTITGIADFSLYLEIEFYDSDSNRYEIAMGICQGNESTEFETWIAKDMYFDYFFEEPIPDGFSINKGAFGLYCHDNIVRPYFKDVEGNVLYPFLDNDFEAYTFDGGTVKASVNLEQVVYGPGSPVKEPPSMPWIPLLLLDD